MKKFVIPTICITLTICSAKAQEWPVAKPEARPYTRWWWMGSAVDEANLAYSFEEYSKAGIGGVEITPIYGVQDNDANDIPFLSPRWMQMLRFVEDCGKRFDIEVNMNTGTGWPFGGPSVTIDEGATRMLFRKYALKDGEQLTERIEPEDSRQIPVAKLVSVMAYSDDGKALNINSKVKDGKLLWTPPAGNRQIIALFEGKTFQMVKRAAPGGEGYVMDHYSKQAVDNYLAVFDKAFKSTKTPYPHTFFNDSYEVYGSDWTPGLLKEFERLRGYKLEEHFPAFIEEASGTARSEETARVVSDYRETISDLLKANFTRRWTDWAHRNGSLTRNQAHGSPGNLIDIYALVDIPECEGFGLSDFGIKGLRTDSIKKVNDSDLSMLKYASSAAHISGKQYTSSETFTWLTDHFRTSIAQCKPDLDLLFVSGVNHIFFHGTNYSPRDAEWPGWRFYAAINVSPTNPLWRDFPAFFDYIRRSQSFLQLGKPDNDFLLYVPIYDIWNDQPGRLLQFDIHKMKERAPKFIDVVNEITRCGYDVDYISDDFIRKTGFSGGKLQTTGGARYKALIVPATRLIPDDVLDHLLKLARQGADIVFLENYPSDVPGFGNLEQRRRYFRQLTAELPPFAASKAENYGSGRIITGTNYDTTLGLCKAVPEEIRTKYGLSYIRRTNDDGYHYFVSALHEKDTKGWATLSVPAAAVAFFDPMTGETGRARTRTIDGKTQIYLQLLSGQSIIIKTYNENTTPLNDWRYYDELPYSLSLDHGWSLRFVESYPAINGTFDIDRPVSWTTLDLPDARRNSGTGLYSVTIDLPRIACDEWLLDLGDVRESARIRINGQDAGIAYAVPYRVYVGKYLREGKNSIEIEVTNLPANRIADYDRRGIKWRKFKEINVVNINYDAKDYSDWGIVPSGLNGQVKLIPLIEDKTL